MEDWKRSSRGLGAAGDGGQAAQEM
jgi:hypothetical protein